jgi:hypothetical protein
VLDFEVQKFTRRCAATDRELRAGDSFYSVLIAQDGQVVRRDYAVDAWHGPPDGALGWWKSQVPDPRANRLYWAPHEVTLRYFQQLIEEPSRGDLCYVLALLMIRRRIFKLEATEVDADGTEVLVVYCPRIEAEYRIPVRHPDVQQVAAIQQELAALLFARADAT